MVDEKVTHGFGVPNLPMPHQFLVRIPKGRTEPVEVWEDFGVRAVSSGTQSICRTKVPREAWRRVADGVKSHLNRRLKKKDIKPSRFSVGDNRVERILGREICVLAWAIENASADEADIAFTRWHSHKHEELWWLFLQIDKDGGEWDSPMTGWRAAIRLVMITDGGKAPMTIRKLRTGTPAEKRPNLFSDL